MTREARLAQRQVSHMPPSAPPLSFRNPAGFALDFDRLQAFEAGLNPDAPDRSAIPCRVLGYGEISTVFEIHAPSLEGLAFKRMSIFEQPAEFERYFAAYEDYNQRLQAEAGLRLPAHGHAAFANPAGRLIFYIIQQRLPREAFGHQLLAALPETQRRQFFERLLRHCLALWTFNARQPAVRLGLDGQLSNWALVGPDPAAPDVDAADLFYLDTSTPFLRLEGREQLDPELFLRTAPSFLAWVLRVFFLKEVLDRYYDFRKVVLDLVANLHKDGRAELAPEMIATANRFFADEAAALGAAPLTAAEVDAYYREDARIWSLFLSARYLDRFIRRRLLRRPYPYLLPGRIKR
jgi:hypothetical protein